jgi:hypothetical protein
VANEHLITELGNDNLSTTDDKPENDKDQVLVDALKDVPLVVDLTCAQHVEDLHEHESSEDESQVTRCTFKLKFFFSCPQVFTIPTGNTTWEDET